jgi:CheY-like chemotaxis protein
MKKIIFTDRVKHNVSLDFFEELSDLEVLTAYSNADALKIHGKEKAALIITELFGSGMSARQFCAQIRDDGELRDVSITVCCRDNEIELDEAAQCRAQTSGATRRSIDCLTENISMTGMPIKADAELRRGDVLQYSLDLAPARLFSMQAEIVRNDGGRYGVRFSRIDPVARRAIETLVSQNPSRGKEREISSF